MRRNIILPLAALCLAALAMAFSPSEDNTRHAQLLEIYDVDGSAAKARLTVNGKVIFETDVHIGRNGVGKQREGDKKTPLGTLHARQAFGILPNPGTRMPYINITPTTFACSDSSEHYNKVIDTTAVHHRCAGEDMYHISPDYNYGITTDYNPDCTYGLGSNIFIHCKGNVPSTAGCIAFDTARMIDILQHCDTNLLITIRK